MELSPPPEIVDQLRTQLSEAELAKQSEGELERQRQAEKETAFRLIEQKRFVVSEVRDNLKLLIDFCVRDESLDEQAGSSADLWVTKGFATPWKSIHYDSEANTEARLAATNTRRTYSPTGGDTQLMVFSSYKLQLRFSSSDQIATEAQLLAQVLGSDDWEIKAGFGLEGGRIDLSSGPNNIDDRAFEELCQINQEVLEPLLIALQTDKG